MLTISFHEFRDRVKEYYPGVVFSNRPRSLTLAVLSLKFYQSEWSTYWQDYKKARNLTYFNEGMCELFSQMATGELTWSVLKEASRQKLGDVSVAAAPAVVTIPPGSTLCGVRDGCHSTVLLAASTPVPEEAGGGDSWDLWFWEPQAQLAGTGFTNIYEAKNSGIVLDSLAD